MSGGEVAGLAGMVDDLIVSTVMVLATVAFHGAGLILLTKLLRIEAREELVRHLPAFSPRTLAFTLSLVLALFLLHGLEIWMYAFVYVWLGAVSDIATGVFFFHHQLCGDRLFGCAYSAQLAAGRRDRGD